MSDTQIEAAMWWFGLVLFGLAMIAPRSLTRLLGGVRFEPHRLVFFYFRILAAVCVVGTIYRLATLYKR
jgi:hypothetical protein